MGGEGVKNGTQMYGAEFGVVDATEDVAEDTLLTEGVFGDDSGGGGGRKSEAPESGERYVTLGFRREDEDESFGIGTMGLFMVWERACVEGSIEIDVDWARGDGVDGLKWIGQREPGTVAEARVGSSTSIIVARCWSSDRTQRSMSDGRRCGGGGRRRTGQPSASDARRRGLPKYAATCNCRDALAALWRRRVRWDVIEMDERLRRREERGRRRWRR